MSGRTLRPCGEDGILVEVGDLDAVLALAAAVRAAVEERRAGFAAVVDVVPAAETVLVTVAEGTGTGALRRGLATLRTPDGPGPVGAGGLVEVGVRYDGPDLDEVAGRTGLSPAEVVAAHTGTPWRVAFGGFAPGFAYLVGGDPRLRVPRREEPRTSVPAGAVALAGGFSAVYPRASPGGWQLVGRTEQVVWDVHRDPPALLEPGATVRFVDLDAP